MNKNSYPTNKNTSEPFPRPPGPRAKEVCEMRAHGVEHVWRSGQGAMSGKESFDVSWLKIRKAMGKRKERNTYRVR